MGTVTAVAKKVIKLRSVLRKAIRAEEMIGVSKVLEIPEMLRLPRIKTIRRPRMFLASSGCRVRAREANGATSATS